MQVWQAASQHYEKENAELKAQVNKLLKVLEFYSNFSDSRISAPAKIALAETEHQSLAEHDAEIVANHQKALEFAEYMAKCIEQFMVTVNELDIADEKENETLIDILQERRGEYWRAVNTSVYEFRKRADKALKAQ